MDGAASGYGEVRPLSDLQKHEPRVLPAGPIAGCVCHPLGKRRWGGATRQRQIAQTGQLIQKEPAHRRALDR
jgi:hypothetical protein